MWFPKSTSNELLSSYCISISDNYNMGNKLVSVCFDSFQRTAQRSTTATAMTPLCQTTILFRRTVGDHLSGRPAQLCAGSAQVFLY